MLYIKFKISIKCIHDTFVSRQSLEGHRRDELACILSHYDMNACIQLHEHRRQIGDFVGCYATCDTQYYVFSC